MRWPGGQTEIGAEGGIAIGATTALGGAAAGIYLNASGEINSVKGSASIFKNFGTAGDTQPRFQIVFSGEMRFGVGGSTAPDIGLARSAAGKLSVTDGTSSATFGDLRTNGLRHGMGTSPGLAFFNATAIAKQTVTGAKGGNAALGSLLTALAAYGLVTDSSTA